MSYLRNRQQIVAINSITSAQSHQLIDKQLKRELCIKYLGIMINSNLNWKEQVDCVVKKILEEENSIKFIPCPNSFFYYIHVWSDRLGKYL